ncbi:uncharacterized protein UMAG_15027 [Mycosarcoma maydis]|uniref:Endonuclease/exonuclease/phosphatase domain-containing protein n=1 Tax=Mycosarcoma maydis TaxID=5270 RepID=A0A0D1BVK3_MYCMD|nr:uncharacterized protein UMAG_15027 [Ustilago maydis 521]KIS66052.1 hypothetical protein UMAG_15027 [Ustilago maydis 521]|eukprot:XP_011392526.1 hypothetical protein UMAG_15027 [Ustilago maydis 521]
MAPTAPTRTSARRASSRTTTDTRAASPGASSIQPKRKAVHPVLSEQADATQIDSTSTDATSHAQTLTLAKKPRKKSASDSDSASAPKSQDTTADPSLPKNTQMPATLSFARPRAPGSLRITAWNITSLKSSEPKGMLRYLEAEDADIAVLSETKVNDVPMHPALTKIYKHQYWAIGKQKGYAGLAILSKIQPIKAIYGLPSLKDQDTKGRIVTLEFENSFLVGTYAVNAGLAELDAQKPIIWCGDLNVVQDERDLAAASKKWNKSPGYTAIECDAHRQLLQGTATPTSKPLVDVWRQQHPDAIGHYTFYGWRGFCRSKGIGWRLDSFILSERIAPKALECEIRHECYGASDHVPIYCDIQGPL